MKTSGEKNFKNEMQSQEAYYECILCCEINPCSSSWQGVEEDCETKCLNQNLNLIWCRTLCYYLLNLDV